MGGDSRKTFSAYVAESGPGVGARIPVMHPREMFHVKLGHLETRRQCGLAKREQDYIQKVPNDDRNFKSIIFKTTTLCFS